MAVSVRVNKPEKGDEIDDWAAPRAPFEADDCGFTMEPVWLIVGFSLTSLSCQAAGIKEAVTHFQLGISLEEKMNKVKGNEIYSIVKGVTEAMGYVF